MGNAQTGAKTDVIHDVQMGCKDDAWTGATTDISHDVWMCCTDNAWTGAMMHALVRLWLAVDILAVWLPLPLSAMVLCPHVQMLVQKHLHFIVIIVVIIVVIVVIVL